MWNIFHSLSLSLTHTHTYTHTCALNASFISSSSGFELLLSFLTLEEEEKIGSKTLHLHTQLNPPIVMTKLEHTCLFHPSPSPHIRRKRERETANEHPPSYVLSKLEHTWLPLLHTHAQTHTFLFFLSWAYSLSLSLSLTHTFAGITWMILHSLERKEIAPEWVGPALIPFLSLGNQSKIILSLFLIWA